MSEMYNDPRSPSSPNGSAVFVASDGIPTASAEMFARSNSVISGGGSDMAVGRSDSASPLQPGVYLDRSKRLNNDGTVDVAEKPSGNKDFTTTVTSFEYDEKVEEKEDAETRKLRKKKLRRNCCVICCCLFCCLILILFILLLLLTAFILSIYFGIFPLSAKDIQKTPPQWAAFSLKIQSYLARDEPIDKHVFPGSHNSYNSLGYSSGAYDFWPNQVLTMTEQLNIGVRFLELDLHYLANTDVPDKFVVCHATDETLNFYTKYCAGNTKSWYCKAVGIQDLGTGNVGCNSKALSVIDAVDEISKWITDSNDGADVILIKLEDQVSFTDYNDNEIGTKLNDILRTKFGSALYTPADLETYRTSLNDSTAWPTLKEMRALEKYVIVYNQTKSLLDSPAAPGAYQYIFDSLPYAEYPATQYKYFESQDCSSDGVVLGDRFTYFYEDLSIIKTIYNKEPIYDGPTAVGKIDSDGLQKLMKCGFSASLDRVDGVAIQDFVWSFNDSNPKSSSGFAQCAVLSTNGRWLSESCTTRTYPYACVSNIDDEVWIITITTGVWSEYVGKCPNGYSFSTPKLPRLNQLLFEQITATASIIDGVWLSLNDRDGDDFWSSF